MNHTLFEFGCSKNDLVAGTLWKKSNQIEMRRWNSLKKYPDEKNPFAMKFTRNFSICNIFSSANHIMSVHCRCGNKLSTHFKQSRLNCVTKPKSFCVERNKKHTNNIHPHGVYSIGSVCSLLSLRSSNSERKH